jgi:hypothetical protein
MFLYKRMKKDIINRKKRQENTQIGRRFDVDTQRIAAQAA